MFIFESKVYLYAPIDYDLILQNVVANLIRLAKIFIRFQFPKKEIEMIVSRWAGDGKYCSLYYPVKTCEFKQLIGEYLDDNQLNPCINSKVFFL